MRLTKTERPITTAARAVTTPSSHVATAPVASSTAAASPSAAMERKANGSAEGLWHATFRSRATRRQPEGVSRSRAVRRSASPSLRPESAMDWSASTTSGRPQATESSHAT
eukprot:5804930-Prymnesium_polylepis.2